MRERSPQPRPSWTRARRRRRRRCSRPRSSRPLDELQRARMQRLRAQIAFALRRGSDAPALLLDAAKRLVPLDPGLARETCLEALAAAIFAGRLGSGRDVLRVVRATPPAQPPAASDLLLNGLATLVTQGYAAAVAPLRSALEAFRRERRGQSGQQTAGSGWRAASPRISGSTRSGTSWPPAACAVRARQARSASFPCRPATAPACTCTPASTPRRRRCWRRPTRSPRRPTPRSWYRPGRWSPPGAATRPRRWS